MRYYCSVLLIFTCLAACPVAAETSKRTCLDSDRVRNWVVLDDQTLLLDAGRKKYRVDLMSYCVNLSISPVLRFKGDPTSGRICNGTLDAIIVGNEMCRISKIEEIDKKTFNNAQNKKKISLKVKKS